MNRTIKIRLWFARYKINHLVRRLLRKDGTRPPGSLHSWFDASDSKTVMRDKSGNVLAWVNKANNTLWVFPLARMPEYKGATGVKVFEVKEYDYPLSDSEINDEEEGLSKKWGIK